MEEVELKEDHELGVMSVLRWIYALGWSDGSATEKQNRTWWKLENHAHVYVTAQKYGITELADKSWTAIDGFMDDRLDFKGKKEPFDIKEALHILWLNVSPNNTVVRPALAKYCAAHFDELMEDAEFVELMDTTPCLGTAVSCALNNVNKKEQMSEELSDDE